MQVTLTFQALIHFTDWVVGHAHPVMFGVFGFWILGIMTYLFPRLWRTEWYSRRLAEWHYGLSTFGMLIMFVTLVFAGIFQGFTWASRSWWGESIFISLPFWYIRLVSGLIIIAGQVCFAINLYQTYFVARLRAAPDTEAALAGAE